MIPTLLTWLVLTFGAGHSALANLTNEQIPILQYAYERAVEADIDEIKFVRLINCESRIQKSAKGDYRSETDTFISQGILQFQKKTFDIFSKKYGMVGTWLSPYSQINLASIMIKNGLASQWYNCALKVKLL